MRPVGGRNATGNAGRGPIGCPLGVNETGPRLRLGQTRQQQQEEEKFFQSCTAMQFKFVNCAAAAVIDIVLTVIAEAVLAAEMEMPSMIGTPLVTALPIQLTV